MRSFSPAFLRRLISVCLVLVLLAAPAAALDDDGGSRSGPTVGEVVFDVAVLRTLGFVQMVVGAAFFVVAGPLSYPSGSMQEAFDVFVQVPYDETFTRKLGRF
jgi:hypothetical protein